MVAAREPLSKWRFPNSNCLKGNEFPSGRPPFAPFPTITNILNASLCPLAIYHDMMHGIDNALIPQFGEEKDRGDLFHSFVAFLKNSLKNQTFILTGFDVRSQIGMVQDLFLRFSHKRGYNTSEASALMIDFVEPWVRRKLENGELANIKKDDSTIFELSIANAYVPFPLDEGVRRYPLRGRVDEIDIKRKCIIERTIKGTPLDKQPPVLKDYQVWLEWKVLCSLNSNQLPKEWESVDFNDYRLIVETPYCDFQVDKENIDFVKDTHSCYAWINDISISESNAVSQEVYNNVACSPILPHPYCGHPFLNCFPRDMPYPMCRSDIKKTFKPWYRLLLWEKMWEGDLYQYQLVLLTRSDLIEQGLISEGDIISVKDNKINIQVDEGKVGSIRGFDRYTIIPFGTLNCGKRETATLVDVSKNQVTMELFDDGEEQSKVAILLPQQSESSPAIMQDPPIYLKSQMQKNLLRLQYSGVIKPERAMEQSQVQLLEGVFGRRPIRRGSK